MNKRIFYTILVTVLIISESAFGLAVQDSTIRIAVVDTLESAAVSSSVAERVSRVPERRSFLPTRYRMDREINKIKYVYKGEIAIGMATSYGTISSDDTDFLLIVDNINLEGSIFTINPSVGYFIKDNLCLGVRFGYTRINGDLNSAALNLGEANDVDISLSNISLNSDVTAWAIFMRSYAGIDSKGHFGLFGEMETVFKYGSTKFAYESDGRMKHTNSNSKQFKVSFNGGLAVYIFPNICSTLSFRLGEVQFNSITQKDSNGAVIGTRKASKMLFKLNLADIRIGVNIHL